MATFQTPLITEEIDNKYARVAEPFMFWSDVLEKNGYGGQVAVPVDFIFDYESIPRIPIVYWALAHTSKRGGTAHDYLYRFDSIPIVPREIADAVYEEIMTARKNWWWRRMLKYYGVRWFGRWSYHNLSVFATYDELRNK